MHQLKKRLAAEAANRLAKNAPPKVVPEPEPPKAPAGMTTTRRARRG